MPSLSALLALSASLLATAHAIAEVAPRADTTPAPVIRNASRGNAVVGIDGTSYTCPGDAFMDRTVRNGVTSGTMGCCVAGAAETSSFSMSSISVSLWTPCAGFPFSCTDETTTSTTSRSSTTTSTSTSSILTSCATFISFADPSYSSLIAAATSSMEASGTTYCTTMGVPLASGAMCAAAAASTGPDGSSSSSGSTSSGTTSSDMTTSSGSATASPGTSAAGTTAVLGMGWSAWMPGLVGVVPLVAAVLL